MDFVEWLTKPTFKGDKSLMTQVKGRLKWLRDGPSPKDPRGREADKDVPEAAAEQKGLGAIACGVELGEASELRELARRLSKLKWPDGVLPPDGARPGESINTLARHSKRITIALNAWDAATDEERNRLRSELKLSIKAINRSQTALVGMCRARELIEWQQRVEADKQLVSASRFPGLLEPVPHTRKDEQQLVELDPIDKACLRCLHEVGRRMQNDPSLNMGLKPLQVFCASYMAVKGRTTADERIPSERYAVVAQPRFPAWRDMAVGCILEHCQDAPILQWMTEANVVRNLVRVVGWAMMFEHGRNRPNVLRYYKRWLHAALRDSGRMPVDDWAQDLYSEWFYLDATIKEDLRPPAPFDIVWKAMGGEVETDRDLALGALIEDWPLLPELRIDGDAFKRKSAGVVPTSTSSRWLVMQPIRGEWIRPLHSLADTLRAVWEDKWTVALVSKLGYFAVLPPDQRDEPKLDGARAICEAMTERIALMCELRALQCKDRDKLKERVRRAIDVNSRTDTYRSYGQGRGEKWLMYGERYAGEVKRWGQSSGVDGDSLEFALTLYCARVRTDSKDVHAQSRMMQYMARLSVDDASGSFKSIWSTWVAPRDSVRGAKQLGVGA